MNHLPNSFRIELPNPSGKQAAEAKALISRSPEGELKVNADTSGVRSLIEDGIIDDFWAQILVDLDGLEPTVVARLLYPDHIVDFHLHAEIGNGVLLSAGADEAVELRHSISVAEFVGELLGPFQSFSAAPPTLAPVILSPDGLLTLFGLTDRARAVLASSLVQRLPLQGIFAGPNEIAGQFEESAKAEDNRWLCKIASHMDVKKVDAQGAFARHGISELQSAGFVMKLPNGEDDWVGLTPTVDLANRMLNPAPILILGTGRLGREAGLADNLVLVGGWSLLRIVCGGAENEGQYIVSGIDGVTASAELMTYLAASCGLELPGDNDGIPDGVAGDEVAAEDKLPMSDETGIDERSMSSLICSQCGTSLRANTKFCTNCGAKQ